MGVYSADSASNPGLPVNPLLPDRVAKVFAKAWGSGLSLSRFLNTRCVPQSWRGFTEGPPKAPPYVTNLCILKKVSTVLRGFTFGSTDPRGCSSMMQWPRSAPMKTMILVITICALPVMTNARSVSPRNPFSGFLFETLEHKGTQLEHGTPSQIKPICPKLETVSKYSLHPFLLNMSWPASYKMSKQQARHFPSSLVKFPHPAQNSTHLVKVSLEKFSQL